MKGGRPCTVPLTPSFADLSSYDLLSAKEKLQYEVDAGLYDAEHMKMGQQALLNSYYTKYYNVLSGFDTPASGNSQGKSVRGKSCCTICSRSRGGPCDCAGRGESLNSEKETEGREGDIAGITPSYGLLVTSPIRASRRSRR